LSYTRTQRFCGLVDTRDEPFAQRRSCVANSRRGCGDSEGGDAAIVECRKPGGAGIVLADTCIVEDRSKTIDAQGLLGVPADQAAMRARDDDRIDIFCSHQRGRVDQHHGAGLLLACPWQAGFVRRGWRCG